MDLGNITETESNTATRGLIHNDDEFRGMRKSIPN